jgi:hypothetical protein
MLQYINGTSTTQEAMSTIDSKDLVKDVAVADSDSNTPNNTNIHGAARCKKKSF